MTGDDTLSCMGGGSGDGPPTCRQRKAGDTRRAEIVAAVMELLDEVGVAGVTTTAIAKRIGIAQGSLFRHFPTKAAMWGAVLENISAQVLPFMLEAKNTPGTPLVRLRKVMHTWLALGEKVPALSALMFSRELFCTSAELRGLLAVRIQRPHAMYTGLIQEAIAEGTMRADIDVPRTGWMLVGLLHGLLIRRMLMDPTFDVHADLDVMLDTVLTGLLVRPGAGETRV